LLTGSKLVVAIAAIYRSAFTRLERYFCGFTTSGTHCGEHLTVEAASVALGFPCFAACRATLGLMSIAFRSKELLFLSGEGVSSPTISARECFVFVTH